MFLGPSATVANLCLVTVLSNTQENSPFFTLMKGMLMLPRMGILGGPGGRLFPFFFQNKNMKVRKSKKSDNSDIPTIVLHQHFLDISTNVDNSQTMQMD